MIQIVQIPAGGIFQEKPKGVISSAQASRVDLPALSRGKILGLQMSHPSGVTLMRHETRLTVWMRPPGSGASRTKELRTANQG